MVEISNFTKTPIDKKFLEKIVRFVLKKEGINRKSEVSIVFISEQKMKEINNRYRKKNEPTDVLSFSFVLPPNHLLQLGEILICPAQVRENAKLQKEDSWRKELARVLIHGILHLLGYSHYALKERRIMETRQEKYFSNFF
jgi:probable rRNA maturation factor